MCNKYERQSGRTFRIKLKALLEASSGNNVAIVTRNQNCKKETANDLYDMSSNSGALSKNNIVKIANAGNIYILTELEYENKRKGIHNFEITFFDLI